MHCEIDISRFWSIVRRSEVCMLVTMDGGMIRARPMAPIAEPRENAIWFFTDRSSHKKVEAQKAPRVCLTFQDPDDGLFLSVSGEATLSAEEPILAEKWNEEAETWFPKGPGDPDARLLRVRPEIAEYWRRPYDLATVRQKLTDARERGESPDLGPHGRLSF